jgi:hypothetical protein
MLLRARTVKVWGWAFPLLVPGGCDRLPHAAPSITITKILAVDGNDYDTIAAIEGTSVDVRPGQQIFIYRKSQVEQRCEHRLRRRPNR